MPDASGRKANPDGKRLAAIDQLLMAAIKLGPGKKREAINKVLALVPEWTRLDCWQRIRRLRRISELAVLRSVTGTRQRNRRKPARSHGRLGPMDTGGRRQIVELGWIRTSKENCSAAWTFRTRGPLPAWCTRDECQGHRRLVAAGLAEVIARKSRSTEISHRKRHAQGARSAHICKLPGGTVRQDAYIVGLLRHRKNRRGFGN